MNLFLKSVGTALQTGRYRVFVCPVHMVLSAILLLLVYPAHADSLSTGVPIPVELSAADNIDTSRDWYFFIAAVNVYPRLESEELVKELFEPVLKGLAPGHDGVYTVSDLRDDHALWPPHLGMGYNINRRWSVFLEAGYTAGKVRTKTDDPSIILLPLHTDFEIKRTGLFAGVGVDYFPWGMPEQRDYDGIRDRLKAARPFLGTRLTVTRATYRAKAKLGISTLPNFFRLELSDGWTLPSLTAVAGVDIPLSKRTAFTINGGYNHFWDREFDFEGWAFTLQWKYFFHGPENFQKLRPSG